MNQDVNQFREVAKRLASVLQSSPDRITALNTFVEAVSDPEVFTDIIVGYAGRWLSETGGQTVLVGPEMFWQLSAPGGRGQASISESSASVETGCGERARKMLLVCVLESLAHNQQHSAGAAEHRKMGNNLADSRFAESVADERTLTNTGIINHRLVNNGSN
jgi:hypothetical protein